MGPNKTTVPAETWLDTAVKKIRFGPDRAAVRAELSAHLEDKTLDFQRIFPDMTREEAQERAVSNMGDPAEVGKELAKVHKPWLGYLWRASQVLLGVALTAAILSFQSCQSGWENLTEEPHSWYGTDWPDPVPSMYQYSDGLTYRGALADSGPIQAGEYTFTTEAGELWTVTVSGEPLRVVYFQMDVTHRRPLESLNPWAEDEFWAEDDQGGVLLSHHQYSENPRGWDFSDMVRCTPMDSGIFTDRYEVMLAVHSPEAERVDLRYTLMGADLTIPISLEVTEP